MEQKNFDFQKVKEPIRELCELMKQLGLVEIEVKDGSKRIFLKREMPISGPAVGSIGQPLIESKDAGEKLEVIKSPMLGIFFRSHKPDSKPFVKVGSEVTPQTVVCIIDAMKVLNEIEARTTGTIVEISAENGQAIEFGQPLFKVKPSNKSL